MRLAARGSRKTGDTTEAIEDELELDQVRRQSRQVTVKSMLAAVGLTLIALVVPARR